MKKFFILIIYLFLLIIQITYEDFQGLLYPNLFTLLSQKILMVASDGIHFLTSNMEDDNEKKIIFDNPISSEEENKKVNIVQYSKDDGGYIIILAQNKLYFFKPDGVYINSFNFNEEAEHYCINPYKLENNYLYYTIEYLTSDKKFVINYNKFNLNSKENENILSPIIDIIVQDPPNPDNPIVTELYGVECVFMSDSTKPNDILGCFYSLSFNYQFQARFFDLSNDKIIELTQYFKWYPSDWSVFPKTISVITDPNREIAFLYLSTGSPITQTFSIANGFSELNKIPFEGDNFNPNYSYNKLFYFRQIHEYLCVSSYYGGCKLYMISFNDDFSLKNQTIYNTPDCWGSKSFSAYFDGMLYGIANDVNNNAIVLKAVEEMGNIEVVEDPIIIEDNNNIQTTILNVQPTIEKTDSQTTFPIVQTTNIKITIPTTIPKIQTTNMQTTIPTIKTTYMQTTILTTIPTIQTTNIQTTIPIIQTTIPIIQTTNIQTTILTTIPAIQTTNIQTTILTTILTTTPTIQTTNIQTTILTTIPIIQTTNIQTTFLTTIPTIQTTYMQTTILTTIPTIPTTILTTIPTIQTTYMQTTILTTIPIIQTTNIQTTILTIQTTNIQTTILTTILTIQTTIPTIQTTIIQTTIPTIQTTITKTILTTISITESTNFYQGNIKCKISTPESSEYDLCISCNNERGFYPAEYPPNYFPKNFINCYNNDTKPINFYFDSDNKIYKVCYETCLTCDKGGDEYINNCLTCDVNHIKKPETPNTTNCVPKCNYAYYFTPYGQYKCTEGNNCPNEAKLLIKEKNKCTNNCKIENKFEYGGQCLESCPSGTIEKSENKCMDQNDISCIKSESEINLQEFLTTGGVDFNAKNYAIEFNYTTKHVSHFYNNIYSILIYKDSNCIEELSINMPKIDFGNCYSKVKGNLSPPSNDSIIIALVERSNGQKKSSVSYTFYHPKTGIKIDADSICKDEQVVIKESVLNQLNNSETDLNSILFLANQDINIFNLSDEFYTDLCYHFKSPNGKDVPLKDRILLFYPNITLCDEGCENKGVNLTSMESICKCQFSDIVSNEFIEGNALIKGTVDEIADLLSSSNLNVLQCYKDVFRKEYFIKNTGGYIFIFITISEIALALIFFIDGFPKIIKYVYNLTECFLAYNGNKSILKTKNDNKISKKIKKINFPPKRKENKEKKKKLQISKDDLKKRKAKSTKKLEGYIGISTKTQKSDVFLKTNSHQVNKSKLLLNKKSEKSIGISNYIQQTSSNSPNIKLKKGKDKKHYGLDIDMEEYLKQDYDDMDFEDALKYDKRTFYEFFCDRFNENQIIMNTFFNKENIKPMSIKILLLLLNIDLYFVVNGFFFSEEYISQLYHSTEEEKFFTFLPRSFSRFFYTTMVGVVVGVIIDCMFVEEKKIKKIFLREKDNVMQLKYEIAIITRSIKKNYIIFIILCLFISIISWYYVCCFNNVYPGVRAEWIKSSLIIIIIFQIISILTGLIEAILRLISFKYKSEKIYKLKQFLN